jgi:hypothetical protein
MLKFINNKDSSYTVIEEYGRVIGVIIKPAYRKYAISFLTDCFIYDDEISQIFDKLKELNTPTTQTHRCV